MTIYKTKTHGFTLIELMIAVAIVALLASIALPSYNAHTEKTRRADCKVALSTVAQQLERCMTLYGDYTSANCPALITGSDEGYYDVAVVRTATTFTASCAAAAGSPQANDDICVTMTLANTGARTATDSSATDSTAECW